MSLKTPESVWNLQKALAAKAKGSPKLRFYSLYDKIHRRDVLGYAYRRGKANGGSPGPDGQRFKRIEEEGLAEWLDGLTEELREKKYKPGAVKRVWIQDLPANGCAPGMDTQAGREATTFRSALHQGPRSANGRGIGVRADL